MIKSKYMNAITAVLMILVIVFTIVLTYFPETLSRKASSEHVNKTYTSTVFNKSKIMTVDIQMSDKKWNKMLDNATKEEYSVCDIVINGKTYKDVGIRPKGNSSLSQVASSDETDRFSFKIEFDHNISNQTCDGLDKLVLNNLMSDATYMKEYIAYDMMSYMKIPSSAYSFANIKVNGKAWGLYIAFEGVDESFAERNFGFDYGELYQPESSMMAGMGGAKMQDFKKYQNGEPDFPDKIGDAKAQDAKVQDAKNMDRKPKSGMGGAMGSSSTGAGLVYTDDDKDSYSDIFDNAVFDPDKEDCAAVIKAIKNLNNGTDLEKYINVDECLRYIAVNAVIVNLDSYFGTMLHNYYLYEKDGQLSILPWDYNLAFAGFQSNDASDAVNLAIDTVVSGAELKDRPLIAKLLEVPKYKELYHKYLQEIVTGYFDSGLFEITVKGLDKLIGDSVKNDATAFYTYEEYKKGVDTFLQFGRLRAKSIQGQLDGSIPSTEEEQEKKTKLLVNASSISISDMGTQGRGKDGGKDGGMDGKENMNKNQGEPPESPNMEQKQGEQATDAKNRFANMQGKDGYQMQPPGMKGQQMGQMNQNSGQGGYNKQLTLSNIILLGASAFGLIFGFIFLKIFKRRKYCI